MNSLFLSNDDNYAIIANNNQHLLCTYYVSRTVLRAGSVTCAKNSRVTRIPKNERNQVMLACRSLLFHSNFRVSIASIQWILLNADPCVLPQTHYISISLIQVLTRPVPAQLLRSHEIRQHSVWYGNRLHKLNITQLPQIILMYIQVSKPLIHKNK